MANMSRRVFMGVIGAAPHAVAARAQGGWRPSQAVRVIVPAAPGGTTDIMGRLLAAHLQPRWGQSAVVLNKSGGGGTIGTVERSRNGAASCSARDCSWRPAEPLPTRAHLSMFLDRVEVRARRWM